MLDKILAGNYERTLPLIGVGIGVLLLLLSVTGIGLGALGAVADCGGTRRHNDCTADEMQFNLLVLGGIALAISAAMLVRNEVRRIGSPA